MFEINNYKDNKNRASEKMYLPSVNELNKNALQQKIVDENDIRVRKTVMKAGNASNSPS